MRTTLAIKSETKTTLELEGWGVVFGGEDLTAEYFDANTDFWLEQLGSTKVALYDHGQDDAVKSTVLGSGTLERKTADDGTDGLWFTAQLDKSQAYVKQVAKLAKAGVLGASSGAVSHLVERVDQGEKTWIKAWPIAEVSLTVTPCEPRTLGYETLKARIDQAEAVKVALAAAPRRALTAAIKEASYEQIRDQIYAAINRRDPYTPYDEDYSCLVATYPDFVVVEHIDYDADGDGGLFRIPYTTDAAGAVTLGEAEQVQITYSPVTKSLVEHAQALKALLPKEAPAKGASQHTPAAAAKPTTKSAPTTPEIKVSTPPTEQETPMRPEDIQAVADAVMAKVEAKQAPQFDAINKILERYENEPALKNAGFVSSTGGASDKNIKTFGDFLIACRRGDTKRIESVYGTKAALAEEDGTTGGYLVPTEYRQQILQIAAENAIVRPRAMVLPMRSLELELPALDQQTAQAAGTSAFFGGVALKWAAEAGAYDETEPKFKMVRLTARKLEGYTLSSNEMLADSAVALEAFLRTLFGQAVAWFEDFAFIQGDGQGKPLGVLGAPVQIAVNRANANQFALADAVGMLAKLPASSFGRAVWTAHQTVLPQLLQMQQTNAQLVHFLGNLQGDNGLQANGGTLQFRLLGLPGVVTEKVPALGTKGDVMLSDFGAYIIGDRQDMAIASSEHFKFTNGQMTWRVDERVDGQPWMKSAITLADGTNTVSPFVALN